MINFNPYQAMQFPYLQQLVERLLEKQKEYYQTIANC